MIVKMNKFVHVIYLLKDDGQHWKWLAFNQFVLKITNKKPTTTTTKRNNPLSIMPNVEEKYNNKNSKH